MMELLGPHRVAKQKDHMRTTMQSKKRKKNLAATVRPNPPAQFALGNIKCADVCTSFNRRFISPLFPLFLLFTHFILQIRLAVHKEEDNFWPSFY